MAFGRRGWRTAVVCALTLAALMSGGCSDSIKFGKGVPVPSALPTSPETFRTTLLAHARALQEDGDTACVALRRLWDTLGSYAGRQKALGLSDQQWMTLDLALDRCSKEPRAIAATARAIAGGQTPVASIEPAIVGSAAELIEALKSLRSRVGPPHAVSDPGRLKACEDLEALHDNLRSHRGVWRSLNVSNIDMLVLWGASTGCRTDPDLTSEQLENELILLENRGDRG